MTRTPLRISVVIPCYNTESYLAQTVGAALDQQRPPDEVIIVDDGSTDDSLAIASRFETALPGVVRVHSERSGRAARTRNIGAMLATGDALMFLDADDVIRPDTLAALEHELQTTPDGVAVCPWFRLVHSDRGWVQRPPSCAPRGPNQDPLAAWLTGWYHPPCSVMWSKRAFEATGRWDEQAATNDDGDLMMRALTFGVPFVTSESGAGFYRRRADGQLSLSGTRFSRTGLLKRLATVRKIAFHLEEDGRLDRYAAALETAFEFVAVDAEEPYPDLSRQARAWARHYGPSARQRLNRRIERLWGRARAVPSRHAEAPPESVRWGLERAEAVLRMAERTPPPARETRSRSQRPAVSVIVPTFNRADVLSRAIDSVLGQSFSDFELLVVDDGSTDGTASVVARYQDRRVRYLPQPRNAGVSAARNRGLREARADLVAFLDSDDEWLPEKLAQQVELFERLPDEVGLVYTGVECILPDGRRRMDMPKERGDVYRQMLGRNVVHGGGSNVMMRRNVVATAGFFDEGLRAIEDYEYWLRVARFFKIDYVAAPLIRYYDPQAAGRRSQALRANLDTREWFFRKYSREMRRAGVAHLFLLKSMRRALAAQQPDVRAARRLALRAFKEAPTSREALAGLIRAIRHRPAVTMGRQA
ncbi:MAG: glycosyltransferase family 2 protein [Acidobacteria bacterium]|nr:glycosyltransferase family 2 protein [Acidobacteriota bacterium]